MADGDTAEVELEEIRCGNRVFSGSSAPALHEHPINKDLIAHFKSKGDSVSWGIAESIEKYEEDRKKKVSWGTDIASLYDQETECELAREVENRINKALIDMDAWGTNIAKERAPRSMDVDALPEALGDWKREVEVGLKNLWTRERLRLLEWFETKAMINTCIVSCPAAALREKMRELRDNGVYGSSMTPYLLLLRDVFDETDAYVDDLDEELDFNDFFDDEESESEEESEEENVPVVARLRGAAAEPEETPQQRVGASRSAPNVEGMGEIKAKFSRFGQFLGQYFTENRLEVENIHAIVAAAAAEDFDDPQEVNKFLEIMQRQNKIMYDQNEWTVYII